MRNSGLGIRLLTWHKSKISLGVPFALNETDTGLITVSGWGHSTINPSLSKSLMACDTKTLLSMAEWLLRSCAEAGNESNGIPQPFVIDKY